MNSTSALALAAIASAIAAMMTAYLNYRSRPVLMRSIERHSDDLRQIATKWIEQVPEAERPNLTREDFSGLPLSTQVHPNVEDEFLFADIANHVPSEIRVLDTWAEYKKRLEAYNQARCELLTQITNEVARHTGLPSDPKFNYGIHPHAAMPVYQSIFAEIADGSQYWKQQIEHAEVRQSREQYELWAGGLGLAAGSEPEMAQARSVLTQMIQDPKACVNEVTYSKWRNAAQHLLDEKPTLDRDRSQLLLEINRFKSIPILPGKCKYIKWAPKW